MALVPLVLRRSYESLFLASDGWASGTSVGELMTYGIPMHRLVVGKPVTSGDATNTGWMSATDLATAFSQAKQDLGWEAGAMTWQYSSDSEGAFIGALSAAL